MPSESDCFELMRHSLEDKNCHFEVTSKLSIGVIGFEPTTPGSQNQCSSQTELHPEIN